MPHLKPMIVHSPIRQEIAIRLAGKTLGQHGQVDFVLKTCVLSPDQKVDIFGQNIDERFYPRPLALGEIAKDIVFDQIFVARMTDADAHAAVVVANMLTDRAQAVVTGNAPANFDSDLAGRQLDLVMENGGGRWRQFVKLAGFPNGAS